MVRAIEGTPRHLSIHVGGMLVTGEPLTDVVPVERASMEGRVVVQFNKDDVEDLGLIKMDLLGLRTLSAIAECLDLIERTEGTRPDLDALPLDDPRVYDMICAVDTIGLFQIESRAQQQALYQSQPREFNDLVVQVAIIRPGPIQGDAVNPYLRRRQGLEPVSYLHPSLEPILSETKGVILYQEQILRIVMDLAGYTAGEADRFRRAMNRHRSRLEMQSLRDDFVRRCGEHGGLDAEVAEKLFRSVAGFAEFGFCKSHAAAFARTVYETAWLRLEHPAHWLCALLNAQPMGFYHPSVLVDDGRRHGIRTLPVDVTRSRARCGVERVEEPEASQVWALRLGFNYVARLGPAGRAACQAAVDAGANGSVAEFWRHTRLTRPAMEQLIRCGAFDRVHPGRPRRELLWELAAAESSLPPRHRSGTVGPSSAAPGPPRGRGHVAAVPSAPAPLSGPLLALPAPAPELPPMTERDRVAADYAVLGVSTGPHLVSLIRPALDALGCLTLESVGALGDGAAVRVAGLVITRQAPVSAKGFRFFTLADEGAHLDLVFRPAVARRTRTVANAHPLLMVEGTLEVSAGRRTLLVGSVTGLDGEGRPIASPPTTSPHPSGSSPAWPSASHDFR
jgi:error-prone DNA polymerase